MPSLLRDEISWPSLARNYYFETFVLEFEVHKSNGRKLKLENSGGSLLAISGTV